MTIKERIEQDLKTALLSGDKLQTDTLRGLKTTILYAEVETGGKDRNMSDPDITRLLAKEAKKRQETADIYSKVHEDDRAKKELEEKAIIEKYLPTQLSEDEVKELVGKVIDKLGQPGQAQMGAIISQVKEKSNGAADGALIARLVKERLGI